MYNKHIKCYTHRVHCFTKLGNSLFLHFVYFSAVVCSFPCCSHTLPHFAQLRHFLVFFFFLTDCVGNQKLGMQLQNGVYFGGRKKATKEDTLPFPCALDIGLDLIIFFFFFFWLIFFSSSRNRVFSWIVDEGFSRNRFFRWSLVVL